MIRQITLEEMKNDIINKKDFPDAIFMNSSAFFNDAPKYLNDSLWLGLFLDNKSLVSVISVKNKDNGLYVELLETRKGYRRKGYASMLLSYVEAQFRETYPFISLIVVDSEKVKFYQKLGYKVSYTGAVIHMKKQFSNSTKV